VKKSENTSIFDAAMAKTIRGSGSDLDASIGKSMIGVGPEECGKLPGSDSEV